MHVHMCIIIILYFSRAPFKSNFMFAHGINNHCIYIHKKPHKAIEELSPWLLMSFTFKIVNKIAIQIPMDSRQQQRQQQKSATTFFLFFLLACGRLVFGRPVTRYRGIRVFTRPIPRPPQSAMGAAAATNANTTQLSLNVYPFLLTSILY